MSTTTLRGQRGAYVLDERPFAYGRVSMLFRAADEQGQPVCIKLFRRVTKHHVTLKEEFLRELKAQKNLLHQHILPVLDFGTDYGPFGGEPFMIMPLCVGGDLRRLLGPRAFLPLDEAMPIVRRLAMAIDFAHTAGFVHGDIKPENVLFGQSKAETYLCDFGLSKYFRIEESVSSQHTMTAGGGSSAYLSPEQIGENSQSALSDIYSLGVVVYEMLTGRLPFDTNQPVLWQMMAKVSGDIVPPNEVRPTLPATACSALIAALDSIPANRPRSARDFYKQLSSKQQDSPSSVQPPASPSGPPRVFLSYTQTDGKWVERLRVHLRPLERVGLIDLWDESRIAPGSDWRTAIAAAVESAHIAVLLLSPDYLASDFLAGEQLTSLLRARAAAGVKVVASIVRPCDVGAFPQLARILENEGAAKTLSEMPSGQRDRELLALAHKIRAAVNGRQIRGSL